MTKKITATAVIVAMLSATTARAQDAVKAVDPVAAETAAIALKQAKLDYAKQKNGVVASGLTGGLEKGDNAGLAEATLMSNGTMQATAAVLAGRVAGSCKVVILYPGDTHPNRAEAMAFDAQVDRLSDRLAKAIKAYEDAYGEVKTTPPGSKMAFVGPMGLAGFLSLGANLLSYFKSDYQVGGGEIGKDAGKFGAYLNAALHHNDPLRKVYYAAEYLPPISAEVKSAFKTLDEAYFKAKRAESAATLRAAVAADSEPKAKATAIAGELKAAAEAYDTFVKGLMDANDAGERPLAAINAQISLRNTEGVCELGYTVASNAFTTYNRKNILSGMIGQTPLSVFVVVDVVYKGWGSDGQLVASGVVAQTSEKLKLKAVRAKFTPSILTADLVSDQAGAIAPN